MRTASVFGFTLLIATIGWENKNLSSWTVSNQMLDPCVSLTETLMYPMLSVSVRVLHFSMVFDSQTLLQITEKKWHNSAINGCLK